MAKIATASPAAAVMRGFTLLLSALARVTLHHSFGWDIQPGLGPGWGDGGAGGSQCLDA